VKPIDAYALFVGGGDAGHFTHRISRAMNAYLLFAGLTDFAATRHRIARAIREGRKLEAHALTIKPHPFGYEQDLTTSDVRRIQSIEWLSTTGDEGRVFDRLRKQLPAPGRGVLAVHSGTNFRDNHALFLKRDLERGAVARFYGCDLIRLDDGRLPAYPAIVPGVRRFTAPVYAEPPLRVAHAPSSRAKKGTDTIVEAFRGLEGVELDLIEGVGFSECLERRSRAHVVIDQLAPHVGGFGTTSVEAMAQGQVVIADIRHCIPTPHLELPPIVDVRCADALRAALEVLRDEPDHVRELRERAEDWVRRVAAPDRVAAYWIDKLEGLG